MTWFRLLAQNNSEDYFWDFSRKDPKLMSSFTGGEYWIQEDLDLGDLNSFRSAFVHCRRLLMRIPNWAVTYSEDMLFEDRLKMMVKYNLIKMAEILGEAIKQGKDLNRILHAEYEADKDSTPLNPIPKPEGKAPKRKLQPQEQTFQNGITLSSTPTKRQRQEDEVDANKKTLKFFGVKVQVPKLLNLDCSSKSTEVIEISDEESITDPTLSRSEMEV